MKTIKKIAALLLIAACVAAAPVKNGYEVGDKATDFKLKNVDGKMISMADFRDAKGFIVVFDCNTCPYSRAYNDRIIALARKYAPLKYQLIAINANDPGISSGDSFEDNVKEAKRKNYDFPYLVDQTQDIARTYGATNTPHVFVLAKNGNELTVAYIGTIDDNARNAGNVTHKYVEEAVDALLAGKPVSTTRTRAVGCGIKWKDA